LATFESSIFDSSLKDIRFETINQHSKRQTDNALDRGINDILSFVINTHSELSGHVWKLKEENRGRIYKKGVLKLSMHVNYFGDMVFFTGLAMITHSFSQLVIPLIIMLNFIFNIIPSFDRYLMNTKLQLQIVALRFILA
jgi:steroid 5-alpha reductase family enzyme